LDKDIKAVFQQRLLVTYTLLATFFSISTRTIRRTLGARLVKSINGKPAKYTLYGIIAKHADDNGLWKYQGYTFSIYRSLNRTLLHLIAKSPMGLSANELNEILGMNVWRALHDITDKGWVTCVKIGHTNYYFARNFPKAQRQLIKRYNENEGFRFQLKGEIREIIFSKAGVVLKERIQKVCIKRGISLTERENDIIIAIFLRPLLRAGKTDGDLSRFLKMNPELSGFFSFIRNTVPPRSEINEVKQKLDGFALTDIFHELVVWIIEQLKLETISIVIDGTHSHQSRGNKRGIKIHGSCIIELGLPVGFVLLEDGMEYDLNSLTPLLKQIRALNVKVEYVIGDALYDAPEFYYEVMRILEAEGIAPNCKHRLLRHTPPVDDTLLDYFEKRTNLREEILTHNRLRKEGVINQRGRFPKVPEAKVSFDEKNLIGELLRNYPPTAWGSEKRKGLLKKRPIIERLFSILKLWLDLDGLRTKPHTRRWNVFASFISLLAVSILAVITGIPSLIMMVRKFVV